MDRFHDEQRSSKSRSRRSGLSALELVITIVVIAIAASVAFPKLGNSLQQTRLHQAARNIAQQLRAARQASISQSRTVRVEFNLETSVISVPSLTGKLFELKLSESPFHLSLQQVNLGEASYVEFDRFGRPSSGGNIVIASGGLSQTINIEVATGRVMLP